METRKLLLPVFFYFSYHCCSISLSSFNKNRVKIWTQLDSSLCMARNSIVNIQSSHSYLVYSQAEGLCSTNIFRNLPLSVCVCVWVCVWLSLLWPMPVSLCVCVRMCVSCVCVCALYVCIFICSDSTHTYTVTHLRTVCQSHVHNGPNIYIYILHV